MQAHATKKEASHVITCPKCGAENLTRQQYCGKCGFIFPKEEKDAIKVAKGSAEFASGGAKFGSYGGSGGGNSSFGGGAAYSQNGGSGAFGGGAFGGGAIIGAEGQAQAEEPQPVVTAHHKIAARAEGLLKTRGDWMKCPRCEADVKGDAPRCAHCGWKFGKKK